MKLLTAPKLKSKGTATPLHTNSSSLGFEVPACALAALRCAYIHMFPCFTHALLSCQMLCCHPMEYFIRVHNQASP